MLVVIHSLGFAAVCGCALYLFIRAVYVRIALILRGRKSELPPETARRLREFAVNVFGQRKLFKDPKSGIMHTVMFYGFIVLQFGAFELIVKGFVKGYALPLGPFRPAFALSQELAAVLVLFATGYAFYRRYIEKLGRLKRDFRSSLVVLFLLGLMGSLLLTLAAERVWLGSHDHLYEPISTVLARLFAGLEPSAAAVCFYLFWWIHLLVLLSFLVYIPQSKHAHILFAPLNVYLRDGKPHGKLVALDLDDAEQETFGVGRVEDFRRNQLIDLYACVECGRCTAVCPASATGKTLSPMDIIVNMRNHLTAKADSGSSFGWPKLGAVVEHAAASEEPFGETGQGKPAQPAALVGDAVTEEELWACTTCRNCEDQCPVANEHVDKIIDMRRYLVLTEGRVPGEALRYFQNIERQSNPWGIHRSERVKWREGREDAIIPTVKEAESFEYLFFVGSMGSFDNRSRHIALSFARIMNAAGITFAILGNEERNSGDTARRMGNEPLFRQLCEENIAAFRAYGVRKIVTIDPHAYNTFKNEYTDFGLDVEVYHHTELIWRWIREKRIRPTAVVDERIAYHDSCYIGRYNGIYDIPREILKSVPGVQLLEMERSKENAMCCGAGGGLMWLEEQGGKRINYERTGQALSLNPTTIASNCPYCLTMLTDGTKALGAEANVRTLDIAEIVERSLRPEGTSDGSREAAVPALV